MATKKAAPVQTVEVVGEHVDLGAMAVRIAERGALSLAHLRRMAQTGSDQDLIWAAQDLLRVEYAANQVEKVSKAIQRLRDMPLY